MYQISDGIYGHYRKEKAERQSLAEELQIQKVAKVIKIILVVAILVSVFLAVAHSDAELLAAGLLH